MAEIVILQENARRRLERMQKNVADEAIMMGLIHRGILAGVLPAESWDDRQLALGSIAILESAGYRLR